MRLRDFALVNVLDNDGSFQCMCLLIGPVGLDRVSDAVCADLYHASSVESNGNA